MTLALIAALPFLTRPGLPRGTDAELHVFRAAELGASLRAGDLYPRWAPNFYYGYGYPIFNYYAPLTYYLANLFDLLPGADIVAGAKLVFILGLVSAALGTYLFVRDWIGPRPALLAAALYVFSPYVFFVDPHLRGVLAESFSLGLFPLALWAYRRTLVDKRRRWTITAAILQAALIMSHNLIGLLVCTALLLAYLAWESISNHRHCAQAQVIQSLISFSLGVGLSAIFWLPMALERGDVQLTLVGPGHFDFHNHFLELGELLAPSPILDLGATALRFALNLGLPQWPLALTALLALAWGRPVRRRQTAFFVLCAALLVILMFPFSAPIWEAVPGMAFLQFPWRLLGPAGAVLSITAAVGYGLIARRGRWGLAALGLSLGLTLVLALPAMFPPLWEADFGPTNTRAIIEFELTGVAVGTTSTGDYLPVTVEMQPHHEPAYLDALFASGSADKVNRASLPQGTVVEILSHGPTHDRFHVESEESFVLRLFTFYFPGWRATVDGVEVPIELGRPEGFITFKVPAGTHTAEVRLEALGTPARTAGTLISLLSLAALFLLAWRSRSSPVFRPTCTPGTARQGKCARSRKRSSPSSSPRLDRPAWLVAGGVILAFFLFKVALVDGQHDWFRRTSPPGQVLGAQYALDDAPVDFGHHIQLLGYDLPQASARAGGTLPLTLYWRATAPVPKRYQVFAHLTRPAAHLWGQSDNLNPGDFPTRHWPLDKYVWDEHALEVLPGTPPGEYQLTIGLYTLVDGVRVPVFDAGGTPLGDTFTLPTPVQVTLPRRPPSADDLGLSDVLAQEYAGQITLLGAALPDRHIELPGFVHLALLWRAEVDGPDDVTVQIQLVDAAGQVAEEISTPPVDGRYPSSAWSQGEVVRDQYSFWLPGDFSLGVYELRVGLDGVDDWASLGEIEVVGP
ncbi:MAG: 6-pyruvoyl-tetrahydropterin synthase-related protein [Anaerolineae bacterium]